MAGRKDKNTVDYFPHYCVSGKTMFILESKYGNDGYAVWFKILEMLGSSENHYIDCRKTEDVEYLIAKMRVDEKTFYSIVQTLVNSGAIHRELWDNKIIWSYNFVNGIQDAYKRRSTECMYFLDLCKHLCIKCKHKYNNCGEIVSNNTHTIVDNTILDDTIPNGGNEKIKTWRDDFGIYLDGLRTAFVELKNDPVWISDKEKYHPNVDIVLSLEKACTEFWSTEAGWKNKKSSRSKDIDWKATLTNALNQKQNKVYKNGNTSIQPNGYTSKRNDAEERRAGVERLKDISIAILQQPNTD